MKKELETLDKNITLYVGLIQDCWENYIQPEGDITRQLEMLLEMQKEIAELTRHLKHKQRIIEAVMAMDEQLEQAKIDLILESARRKFGG